MLIVFTGFFFQWLGRVPLGEEELVGKPTLLTQSVSRLL
jgi:hypothetical protein